MWPFSSAPDVPLKDAGVPTPVSPAVDINEYTYDYIIVGGGTAGCVLASRLSEDPSTSVLVLERGPIADTYASLIPMISAAIYRKDTLAVFAKSEPQAYANDRVVEIVRGSALGGTSRVNGMLYTRGCPAEYERWKEMGNEGWGYEDVEEYFLRSECSLGESKAQYRGTEGPWINQIRPEYDFGILKQVKSAALAIGIPPVEHINAPDAPTLGYATMDIAMDRSFYRHSTYRAFLPVETMRARQANLKVCTGAVASRIEFETTTNGTLKAVGVHFEAGDRSLEKGRSFFARARKEVVVCSGAIASPQLLLLSGVGPRKHLEEKGIEVKLDLPGVGANLQDHLAIPVMYETPLHDSIHDLEANPIKAIPQLVKYLFTGGGMFSTPMMSTSIFVPSHLLDDNDCTISNASTADLDGSLPANIPDIEIMPIPCDCSDERLKGKGVISLLTTLVKPKSVGSVRLATTDPHDTPSIDLGFLSDPEDHPVLRKCVRLAVRIGKQIEAQGYSLKPLLVPTSDSDADVDTFVKRTMRTVYHYTSTCRMVPKELGGVVDSELRVYGVEGLRVCDTSIFPEIIGTHTMAPAVMVAEKCADMIKKGSKPK